MKKLIALSSAAVMAFSAIGVTAGADDDKITVLVNGAEVVFEDTEPFIENERTLVPMRAIFEALGADVEWDGDTRTVVSYDPISDVSIVLQIDSKDMFVNDEKIELDVPAKIVNDRTVVPIRAIAEGMSSKVDWDGETRTVLVEKDLGSAYMPDPWQGFGTLEELNDAINNSGAGVIYAVADMTDPMIEVKENGYRYLASHNLAEIQAVYTVGSSADVVVRTQPGDTDISGVYGGEKKEEYLLDESMVEIYKAENILYAVWTCSDAGQLYSHSVAVTTDDFDATAVLKDIVEDVEKNHPRG